MAESSVPSAEAAVAATEPTGLAAVTIDPFSALLAFAKARKSGQVKTAFTSFLDAWKEPIDVKVDKRLDLAAPGKGPHQFLKRGRSGWTSSTANFADRMKTDLERQFNLRNLARS
ncbi:MAG: hypothetical protein U1F43_29870 [Myxococcota bacterium]